MKIGQFNSSISTWPAGSHFAIHLTLRSGTAIKGEFLGVSSLPGGDLVRVKPTTVLDEITFVDVESIDAVTFTTA